MSIHAMRNRYMKFEVLRKKPMMQEARNFLHNVRNRLVVLWLTLSAVFVSLAPTQAQSISISPEDLDVFFDWFNTMFSVILPIALIGAGLVAGALFAFAVGTMLKKAFQSLAGGV